MSNGAAKLVVGRGPGRRRLPVARGGGPRRGHRRRRGRPVEAVHRLVVPARRRRAGPHRPRRGRRGPPGGAVLPRRHAARPLEPRADRHRAALRRHGLVRAAHRRHCEGGRAAPGGGLEAPERVARPGRAGPGPGPGRGPDPGHERAAGRHGRVPGPFSRLRGGARRGGVAGQRRGRQRRGGRAPRGAVRRSGRCRAAAAAAVRPPRRPVGRSQAGPGHAGAGPGRGRRPDRRAGGRDPGRAAAAGSASRSVGRPRQPGVHRGGAVDRPPQSRARAVGRLRSTARRCRRHCPTRPPRTSTAVGCWSARWCRSAAGWSRCRTGSCSPWPCPRTSASTGGSPRSTSSTATGGGRARSTRPPPGRCRPPSIRRRPGRPWCRRCRCRAWATPIFRPPTSPAGSSTTAGWRWSTRPPPGR